MSRPELFFHTIEDRIAIYKEFGRTPQSVKADIENIKTWIQSQPHLPKIMTDYRIEGFLILNKFSVEKTKSKIDMYFSIRNMVPQVYKGNHPHSPHMLKTAKTAYWLPLPILTKEKCRVVVFTVIDPNPDSLNMEHFFAHVFNAAEIRLDHDLFIGEIVVWDLKNVSMGHVVKLTPTLVKGAMTIVDKVFSSRLKGLHYLNMPSRFDTVLAMIKTCMKPKLAARIHGHKDLKSLYKFVPREVLPVEYGGNEKSIHVLKENWNQAFQDYAPWFDTLENIKVDESLRPGQPINDDFLGFYGNFRKLDVD